MWPARSRGCRIDRGATSCSGVEPGETVDRVGRSVERVAYWWDGSRCWSLGDNFDTYPSGTFSSIERMVLVRRDEAA